MNSFYIVNSFTRSRFTGNPAGVVLLDRAMANEEMRLTARELQLETVFAEPAGSQYRVAYYTGECRVPLCGHDTIALGAVLSSLGAWPENGSVELLSDVGLIELRREADGQYWMSQSPPTMGEPVAPSLVAGMLGIEEEAVLADPPTRVVSTGSPFLFARLRSHTDVDSLKPANDALVKALRSLAGDALGVYVWCAENEDFTTVYCRCFAPVAGLPEDPVTGSASGALGAYLASWRNAGSTDRRGLALKVVQGVAMGRPGEALVHVVGAGDVTKVSVGGHAVVVAEGVLKV